MNKPWKQYVPHKKTTIPQAKSQPSTSSSLTSLIGGVVPPNPNGSINSNKKTTSDRKSSLSSSSDNCVSVGIVPGVLRNITGVNNLSSLVPSPGLELVRDNYFISMLVLKNGQWIETAHKWEYCTSEFKEVIHCCIDEIEDSDFVHIGFDLWNYDVNSIIAFFNIDGVDMKKSLCPIVEGRGHSYRSTAFYSGNGWHSICIKKSKVADDPDEIDHNKLESVGKIEVKIYNFLVQNVTNLAFEIDNVSCELDGVKRKVNSDKGEISIIRGEKIENQNITAQGRPDFSNCLKKFEIYYYTPQKYKQLINGNNNLQEPSSRRKPAVSSDNTIGLSALIQSNLITPSSLPLVSSPPISTPQTIAKPQPTPTTIPTDSNSFNNLVFIPFENKTTKTNNSKQPPKRKEPEVIVIDDDDETPVTTDPQRKKSKSEEKESLFKPLKKDLSMEEVCSKYSLQDVKLMSCEQLEQFIAEVLGSRKSQFKLEIFEMNEIDGAVLVNKFSELAEMGVTQDLLLELEKILKIVK